LRYLLENPRVLSGDKALQSPSHLYLSRSHFGDTFIGTTTTTTTLVFRQCLCQLFGGHTGLVQRLGQLIDNALIAAATSIAATSITTTVIRRSTLTFATTGGQLRR
jgi:hypothetical protein